jgi:hypothetical protein
MILRDLVLGLAQGRRSGKGLGDGLAIDLPGEAVKGPMTWIVFFMAVAARVATATACGRDGASTHIAHSGDLPLNGAALHLQRG